jgi:hypothetical protein
MERRQEEAHETKQLGFRLALAVIWPVIMGEGAALWALADGGTVFLGSLCVLSMGFAGLTLVLIFTERIAPDPPWNPLPRAFHRSPVGEQARRMVIAVVHDRPDVFFPAFILGGALLSSVVSIGGQIHARPEFYSAAAQVYPVLLVALFVEIAAGAARWPEGRQSPTEPDRTGASRGARRP